MKRKSMEFNQQEYINNFNKVKYTQFNVRLSKEEKMELDELLKKANISGAEFIKKSIKKLKEEGNHIYIITSRHNTTKNTEEGEKTRRIVRKWLKDNDILYDELYFSQDKTREIDALKIDIMIEDSPDTIPTFVKHTHVFCYDCRYNQNLNLENMTRVFSWYDIYRKIQRFQKM